MPVGYMQGSKKARSTPSIANQTSIYGIMGGLAPRIGLNDTAVYRHQQIKGGKGLSALYNLPFAQQYAYLQNNNLLSVNPLSSGGVGKKVLLFSGSRSGSAPQG
jgi:hypothetical protein